jgi:hypothetical protein
VTSALYHIFFLYLLSFLQSFTNVKSIFNLGPFKDKLACWKPASSVFGLFHAVLFSYYRQPSFRILGILYFASFSWCEGTEFMTTYIPSSSEPPWFCFMELGMSALAGLWHMHGLEQWFVTAAFGAWKNSESWRNKTWKSFHFYHSQRSALPTHE